MDGGAGTATAVAIRPACLWCDTAFEPRKAGSPQRFCSSKCRDEFHWAGRRYAERAVLGGLLMSWICGMALRKHARFFQPRNTVRTTRTHGPTKTRSGVCARPAVGYPDQRGGLIEL